MQKILITILKIFFCIFMTLMLSYSAFIILACSENHDLQILLYLFASILFAAGIWIISFKKSNPKVKIIFWLLFLLYFISPRFLPSVQRAFEIDYCMDKGGRWDYVHNRCETSDHKSCVPE